MAGLADHFTSYDRRITVQSTHKFRGLDPGNLLVIRHHPNTTGMLITWVTWVSSWVGDRKHFGQHWRIYGFSSKLLQIVQNVYQRHHPSMASLNKLWVARLWKFWFLKDSPKTGTNGLFLLGLVLILRMKHQRVHNIKPLTGDAKIRGNLDYPYTIRHCLSIYLFPAPESW